MEVSKPVKILAVVGIVLAIVAAIAYFWPAGAPVEANRGVDPETAVTAGE